MMEEVAERAAERTADKLKIELLQTENRIKREIEKSLDEKLERFLGMTPHEHYAEHDRFRKTDQSLNELRSTIIKRVVIAVLSMAGLGVVGGGVVLGKTDSPIDKSMPVIERRVYEEKNNEAHP